jgi:plasmid maintenance system antidote protein VapI
MKAKLEFILKNKGVNATTLARMLDIQPSGLSHILSGRNKPSFDLVVKILKVFPDLNPDWLLLDSEKIFREEVQSTTPPAAVVRDDLPDSQLLPFDAPQNIELSKRENGEKSELPHIFTSPRNLGKKVERVIILYADRSFESYTEL